jgi:endonuclease-8
VPEGDTIHYAALVVGELLAGHVPDRIATPHPRFSLDRWPERLAGRAVEAVEARGKHLLLRFEGDLVIHSHLRMTGAWRVVAHHDGSEGAHRGPGAASGPRGAHRVPTTASAPRGAWLVVGRGARDAVQLRGPVLELLSAARVCTDPRLRDLGPDLVAAALFDEALFLRRLRADDPTRGLGDALLDQRVVAGIGNFWKSEGCFRAGIDPWRALAGVTDDEALAVVRTLRPLMQRAAVDGRQDRFRSVYGRAGRPCPRCGRAAIRGLGQGDDARTTYWCPVCQG